MHVRSPTWHRLLLAIADMQRPYTTHKKRHSVTENTRIHASPCPAGACAAPRGIGTRGRPFWKLAALDCGLDIADPCNPSLRLSTLLKPAAHPEEYQSRILDLSQYDASVADYLLALDTSSEHSFSLGMCYCLDTKDVSAVQVGLPHSYD